MTTHKKSRFYIKSGSGQYLACMCIMGDRAAFSWTDRKPMAVNVSTMKMAKYGPQVVAVALHGPQPAVMGWPTPLD